MRTSIQIERKGRDAHQAAKVLRKAMRRSGRLELTAAEAASLTGLPIDRCEAALFRLARDFRARVRVTESGTLHFGFASLEPPTPPKGWRAVLAFVEKNDQLLMRLMTLVLGPVLLFSIAHNAHALPDAILREATAWSPVVAVATILQALTFLLGLGMLMYNPLIGLPVVAAHGWIQGHVGQQLLMYVVMYGVTGFCMSISLERGLKRATGGELDSWLKGAERWARGWLFGPPPPDPLEDERRLMALLNERGGVIALRDLMLLFGWDKAEAEAQAPRLLVDYGGELVVTDEGALVLRFDAVSLEEPHGGRRISTMPAFEREGPPRLWGCPTALGVGLTLICGFVVWGMWVNPVIALFPGPGTYAAQAREGPNLVLTQGLGALPYLLAIAPTIARVRGWLDAKRAYAERAGERQLLAILQEGTIGGPARGGLDEAALVRLGGDIDMARSDTGTPWVHFPLLAAGDREAEALRQQVRQAERSDEVVFDTHG